MSIDNPLFNLDFFNKDPKNLSLTLEGFNDLPQLKESPKLYLKSTTNKQATLNSSVFTFNFADINKYMPEISFENNNDIETNITLAETEFNIKDSDNESVIIKPEAVKRPYIRTKLLEGVCEVLSKVFIGSTILYEDLRLENYELKLFKALITKKYIKESENVVDIELKTAISTELVGVLNNIITDFESSKRKEEKTKFIFKNTIKSLKSKYFKTKHLTNTRLNETKFFYSYFEETAKTKHLAIEVFYDPLNSSKYHNPYFRTLSRGYLDLLFSNARFKTDFNNYINNGFIIDYQEKVYQKFYKMFKKLRNRMRSNGKEKFQGLIDDFTNKMFANKRCKLPWTTTEVMEAIADFKKLLDNPLMN